MKAPNFRWYVLGYSILLLIALNIRSEEAIGISADSSDGLTVYRVGCAPWALAFAFVGGCLYFLLLSSTVTTGCRKMPHLFRRWVAGFVDFLWAIVLPSTLVGLAGVLFEYHRTGTFDWLIERQDPQTSEWLFAIVCALLVMFVIAPSYFALSWWRGKPTPGSCILGFRIVADEEPGLQFWKAGLRALLGSIALLACPSWILAYWLKRNKSAGKFWLDAIFRTHAQFLS
jgi:hypothetical protein